MGRRKESEGPAARPLTASAIATKKALPCGAASPSLGTTILRPGVHYVDPGSGRALNTSAVLTSGGSWDSWGEKMIFGKGKKAGVHRRSSDSGEGIDLDSKRQLAWPKMSRG